jgi:hypothetical protein
MEHVPAMSTSPLVRIHGSIVIVTSNRFDVAIFSLIIVVIKPSNNFLPTMGERFNCGTKESNRCDSLGTSRYFSSTDL